MHFWRALWVVIWLHVQCCYATPISSTTSTATVATATPLVVPPSQLWDGSDGPWSSFYIRVGSPPQSLRVLVSTSSNQPLVVLPGACDSDDSNCATDRGGLFQRNASTTWSPNNSSTGGLYAVVLDSNVGLIPEVQYGSDTLALGYLGSGAPALTSQLVGGITTTDLYTGIFGLNPSATNFSSNAPEVASYMSTLKAENQIPSLSYGYNAGNGYRFNTAFASLTLGGYDKSLFDPNNLTFAFSTESDSDLTVSIKSIAQTSSSGNGSLSSSSFSAFLDTTTPYLWLPDEVCAQFEEAFGITYDNTSGLYLVNDTLHDSLVSQNANITFTLGNATSSETVDIVLPYAAFDLTASSPLVETPTRYFPLKRANATSQVTLGRTFFQEAYLITDYESSTFSVNQMSWNPNAQADIISILPASLTSASSSSTPSPAPKKKSTVPTSTIVAATLCSAAFLTILIASIILIRQRQKKLDILVKTPPTPAAAFTFAHNVTPADCAHCRTHTPSPLPSPEQQPMELPSGSPTQSSMSSLQSSMANSNRRSSTPVPSGLALAPVSPMSPVPTFPMPPSSPGPVIPPRYSSLDRVASPTSYYFPQQNIYELPAREEVLGRGTPVESVLQAALDQVVLNHNQQQYIPYQAPSPRTTTQVERRRTLHSPVYGEDEHPPPLRIQTQHSGGFNSTLNRQTHNFTFDIHPQLRTARGARGSRDLIAEHAERMREWEDMRGPLSPPPDRPLPALPGVGGERERRREEVESPGSGTLDLMEYSWLRLH
ncbi:acid protease [Mollisia scopiformis]|uniref:Acid protease n=1 Tax=Mollisia scopiformis TaxID=149040 RepID=A0A194XS52_MOLSC|nr:acid protease [Mollisia scopiformis]KUJ22874.1 acid protease [Mollisia scopiformis]